MVRLCGASMPRGRAGEGGVMKSIRKNFLYNVVYQLLLIVLPLITTPYVSRVLGVDGVGTYSYTYTIARYFVYFAMLGVQNYGNRSIAAVREDPEALSRTFWQIYGLQFLCAAISTVCYFAFVQIANRTYYWISLIQGVYVLSAILDISWFFFGLEEFKITVTRNIAIKLGSLACIFLFVKGEGDLWKYTLIMALGVFLSQGYLWLYLRRFVRWSRPAARAVLGHLRPALVLFVPVIAVSLYKMMDKVMLEAMSSITQVGYYESAEKILNIPLGVITALGTVMLPRMSNLAAKGQVEESKRYIYSSILFAVFLACAMLFGIAGIASDFVPIFLGSEYLPCVGLLWMLAPTIFFLAWANVIRTQYLIPNHHDRSYIVSVVLGAAVNLLVNVLLIPSMAAMGAAVGTLCAEGVVCIYQTLAVRKELPIGRYLRDTLPFLAIGAGMWLLISWLSSRISGAALALVAEIAIGGAAYLLLSAVYMLVSRNPLAVALLQKRKGNRG